MTSSPLHSSRAFVSSKRRRPAPLYLADEDSDLSSGASSARSSPAARSPRRSRASSSSSRLLTSPAARQSISATHSSRSRYVHNLRSSSAAAAAAAAQLDKPADATADNWNKQSPSTEKDELVDSSGVETIDRRLRLHVSVGEDDGKMSRALSSPPSLLNGTIAHNYRTALRDSDDDSPCNTFKRQRTACASPSHAITPPCSPIVTVSSHSYHCSFPIQPSPSPMLRQLSLDSDSPPAMDDGSGCVTSVHVTASTMYFSRPLSLIIEEAEDIIVPVPYTPTPHPSPASPAVSPRRSREGRLLSLPYAAVTMRRGVRKTQQDAFVCRGEREPLQQQQQQQQTTIGECAVPESFFAVLDGHGVEGGEVSMEASSWLPTYFFSSLAAVAEPSSPSSASSSVSSIASTSNNAVTAAFDTSFAMTDHLVCEEKGYRGGTTACCAYFTYQPDTAAIPASHTDSPVSALSSPLSATPTSPSSTGLTLHLASVGDSRAILFSSSRPPRLLTTDHSTSSVSEQARITAAGGHLLFSHCSLRVNGVLNVTRSIGDRALKQFVISQPQQTEMELVGTDEVLMLHTDGVSNAVSMDQLQAAVSQFQHRPAELADHIVDLALKRGSKDNVTAVCIHIPTYLSHLRAALSITTRPPPSLLTTDNTAHICTPPPSRERRDVAHLPPVPPFTCSPTPSSPSPTVSDSTPLCSVRSAERSGSGSGVWRKAPLTSRSRLSTSFFAMLPDSRVVDESEKENGGDERDVSVVLSETAVVLC